MKFWRVKLVRTPPPISPRLVNDVSTITQPAFDEVRLAIQELRDDIALTKKRAEVGVRAAYRKHPGEEDAGDGTFMPLQVGNPGLGKQREFRTGDSLEVR